MDINASIDIGKNTTELITKLAHSIGTTADKVFPWYVKQVLVQAYVNLGVSIGIVLICLLVALFLRKYAKYDIYDKYWKTNTVWNTTAYVLNWFLAGAAIGTFFVIINCVISIPVIMNPEYAAMKSLMADMSSLLHK